MGWNELEKGEPQTENKKAKEAAIALAKNYARCFSTEEGKAVLDHLVNEYVMGNDTPLSSTNITYEAGYHNGEAGIVKVILNQIQRAQTL